MKIIGILVAIVLFLFSFTKISIAQEIPIHTPKVLVIGIDPTDTAGASLANTYFKNQMGGINADQFEERHAVQTIEDFNQLSNGRIQYQMIGHLRFTDFPIYPNGFSFTIDSYKQCVWGTPEFNPTFCDNQKWQFPYVQYFQNHEICQKAEALNADEIWIYSPPYILAYEAFMIGPNPGYWVNGPSFTIPECIKHIVIVNGAYDTPDNFLHSYGHRVEATIDYLMQSWPTEDRFKYWERFAARNPTTRSSETPFCGNVHFPFNYRFEYDVGSTIEKTSICTDFANFPTYTGDRESYSCERWGCTDRGWQKHWFSFIPHSEGTTAITNTSGVTYQFKKDWWFYILFPENALHVLDITSTPSPSPLPPKLGDANGDSNVDGIDYVIWITHYGQSISGVMNGDFNNDAKIYQS